MSLDKIKHLLMSYYSILDLYFKSILNKNESAIIDRLNKVIF